MLQNSSGRWPRKKIAFCSSFTSEHRALFAEIPPPGFPAPALQIYRSSKRFRYYRDTEHRRRVAIFLRPFQRYLLKRTFKLADKCRCVSRPVQILNAESRLLLADLPDYALGVNRLISMTTRADYAKTRRNTAATPRPVHVATSDQYDAKQFLGKRCAWFMGRPDRITDGISMWETVVLCLVELGLHDVWRRSVYGNFAWGVKGLTVLINLLHLLYYT